MTNTDTAEFAGKVAFITGAGSGIGRATAIAFAGRDAHVIAADRNADDNQDTVDQITSRAGSAIAATCDVTKPDDIQAALQQGIERFGRLDIAFNNAGVELRPTSAADISEDDWDRVLDINLRGVFLCMKYEIPHMLQHGGGTIVNTSSGAGVKGFAGGAAYGASKFGIIGLTKCAALDYAADNIRINAICPGIIDTEMMNRFSGGTDEGRANVIAQEPVGRMGTPEEIAASVLWLSSSAAAFTVGHALVIDGGQTI
jgi:NAD(P)-dependent dehydrogenase (short-subunit alcohol dehydrogenase family)